MMQLNDDYQRDDFLKFLEEDFLIDFKRDIRPVNTSTLSCIQKAQYLGESRGLDLQVFEFVFDGSSNKRVALTKDAFSVMRSSAIYNALAVFHSPDNNDWRFSLLTATPEPTEKGKVSLTYSNPKRLSFFLGQNAKINTPTKFLISKGKVTDFDDLKSRFSIEVVNKEFYKEISQAFTKLVSGQLKLPSTQDKSKTNLEFAVRLIGRIIFCWFLREKKSEAGLSLMPKDLLSISAVQENKDYYHKILEPIFFEVLNKQVKSRREDFAQEPFSPVPYLNGGLFSPQEDDFYKRMNGDLQSQFHNTLIIPDSWLNDFFEILETYNFTIDENTSYDEELSIDPEMLGRIFENLLAEINPETGESARKSTGSYYTPRTIVNYMVDESLLLYLKEQTGINEEKLRAIISYDLSDDSENSVTLEEKERIIGALEKVKILDPACGSGAFPIGALQKIVFILQQIDPEGQLWFKKQIRNTSPEVKRVIERELENKNFDYIRKLGIIRENIYGVDIQSIATEISRLRCFLTLIVDERIEDKHENRGIEPLPNLDFKFVTANSLIGLPKIDLSQQSMFDDYQKIDDLKNIRDQYFNASGIEREQLKTEFVTQQKRLVDQLIKEHGFMGMAKAELTQKLTDWEPFTHKSTSWFDPEWMFGIKDGFDIVIANPPYIQLSKTDIPLSYRKYLISRYGTTSGRLNTFGYFILQGLSLVTENGLLTYIIPNTILSQEYYQFIRKQILEKSFVEEIVNYDEMIFETAVVENITLFLHKSKNITNDHKVKISKQTIDKVEVLKKLSQSVFLTTYKNSFDIKGDGITSKLDALTDAPPLNDICDINQAIALKGDRKASIVREESSKKETYKLLDGRNIQKYLINWSGDYIDYDVNKIHSCKTKDIFLTKEKLFFRRVSSNLIFAYDNSQYFALNTLVVVNLKREYEDKLSIKYLCSLLNSKLLNYYYFHKYKSTKNVFSEIQARSVGLLKIVLPSAAQQRYLVDLVDKILAITMVDGYLSQSDSKSVVSQYENQIDKIVYGLYGLSLEEIAIVEGNQNETTKNRDNN